MGFTTARNETTHNNNIQEYKSFNFSKKKKKEYKSFKRTRKIIDLLA